MFGLFHKKEQKALELGAPVSGQAVPLQEVSDPTFGGEILGKGVAVRPTDAGFTRRRMGRLPCYLIHCMRSA